MKYIYSFCICALSLLMGCSEYPTPESVAPVMSTGEVYDIYRFGATISGSFNELQTSSGPVLQCGILLSEYQSMAEADTLKAELTSSGSKYTVIARKLKSGTDYYYQSYAGSGVSCVKGDIKTFKTATENVPFFSENITAGSDYKSITLSTAIEDEGGSDILTKGFCWKLANGKEDKPVITDNVTNISSSDFQIRIPDLMPDHDYVICAYATNKSGTGYGKTVFVHTGKTSNPSMSSISITGQTNSSVEVKSQILSQGESAIFEKGFCWSANTEPTIDDFHLEVEGVNEIIQQITGLIPNQTYYIRSYAKNNSGIGYGDISPVKVAEFSKPMLSKVSLINRTGYQIQISASIIADGGKTISKWGFCYSDQHMPTIQDKKIELTSTKDGFIQAIIKELTPSTSYLIRAYAENECGIAYSQSICVETLDITQPDSDINGWNDIPAVNEDLK